MEEKTTVVIDIQLDDQRVADRLAEVNAEMEALRKENAAMRKDVKEGTKTWHDVSVQLADNEARLKTLKAEQSALTGQVAQATQKTRQYGTSLKEQSALLNDLRNRYQSLSEEQRNSEGGQAMLKQIQDLDGQLKGTDATMGLFQRNVGDYTNSIIKALGLTGPAAKGAAGAIKTVGTSIKAVAAIPVVAIVTAIVMVIKKVIDAIKGSETQTMRLKEAMAVFEPILNAIKNGFTALANLLLNVVEGAIKAVTFAMEGLARAADWVGSIFGADWGLTEKTEQMKAAAAAQVELTKAENEYIIKKRAWSVESAEIDRDVATLRAKSADREKYSAEERKRFLNEAMDLEEKQAQRRKELAEENLRLLKIRASQTENDAEVNDQLAQAEISLIQADTEYQNTLRNRFKEQQRIDNQLQQESKQAMEAYINQIKQMRSEIQLLIPELSTLEQYLKDVAKTEQAAAERQAARYERQATELQKVREAFGATDMQLQEMQSTMEEIPDTFDSFDPSAMEQFAAAYQSNAQTIEGTSQQLSSAFGTVSSIYQQMADDETKSEEERAEAARNARRWSALQVAANSATAMAKGIAGAMDVPFPANLPALATTIGALVSAIAQARALMEGHAGGGPVGNRFTGATMGPDDTIIRARRSEIVLDAEQQRELWEIANGGGNSGGMTSAVAAAIRNMPPPVLEYSEFKRFEGQVATITENQIIN